MTISIALRITVIKCLNHQEVVSANGRVLRHRFSPKSENVATPISLPKRNRVAKEAVSAAWQTRTRHRRGRVGKPNDAPTAKPRLCVKTMLGDSAAETASRNDDIVHIYTNRVRAVDYKVSVDSIQAKRAERVAVKKSPDGFHG